MPRPAPRVGFVREPHHGSGEVGHVGDGVQCIGVAQEVDLLAGAHLRDEPFTEGRSVDVGAEEVRRPGGDHPDPARLMRLDEIEGHPRPDRTLLRGGTQRQVVGQRSADVAIAVEVLHDDEQRAALGDGVDDGGLQRRELLGPPVVLGLCALVHDVGAVECLAQRRRIGDVGASCLGSRDHGARAGDDRRVVSGGHEFGHDGCAPRGRRRSPRGARARGPAVGVGVVGLLVDSVMVVSFGRAQRSFVEQCSSYAGSRGMVNGTFVTSFEHRTLIDIGPVVRYAVRMQTMTTTSAAAGRIAA